MCLVHLRLKCWNLARSLLWTWLMRGDLKTSNYIVQVWPFSECVRLLNPVQETYSKCFSLSVRKIKKFYSMNSVSWILKTALLIHIYFEMWPLNLMWHAIVHIVVITPGKPVQFMIGFLLHDDLVLIGFKVIFTWSPADLYEQIERYVLFVLADICVRGRLCGKPIYSTCKGD